MGGWPRRFPALVHMAVAIAVGLFGAWPAAADRLDEIRARGYLIAGVKADYHPFGVRNESGKLVGYDVDVARGLADAIGVAARLTPVTSANRLQKLARGEIDVVIATLGDNRSRRRLVHMISPVLRMAQCADAEDSGISTWEGLRGRTLCSVQGSLWNRLAAQRLLVETISLNSTREAALALRNGHCVGWLYDEVNLLSALATGEWNGFTVSLPTRFVAPWAIAIRKEEAGGGLDRLFGDTVAVWHREGFFQELEKRWNLPPSPYLRRAHDTWRQTRVGELAAPRREGTGVGLPEPAHHHEEWAGSRRYPWLQGIDRPMSARSTSPTADPHGLFLTVALSVATVLGSIVLGALFGWVLHRRIPVLAPFLQALCAVLRMTPPLLQLYVFFFGIGGILFAYGFTLDAFSLAAAVLSLYAAASNAVRFLARRRGRRRGSSVLAAESASPELCHAAVAGNSVNIVKATGMASTLALPELVHASTAIIAEKGNDAVMMNLLLLCYFLLVFATVWALRGWERKAHGT